MKRILIVTDAWRPQVNGVVTVFSNTVLQLEAQGYAVELVEPSRFKTLPLPFYPEIRLALFPKKKIRAVIAAARPDAIHIATEGPLGLAARSVCRRKGIPFTTSFHTNFQLYLSVYFGHLFTRPSYAFLRWFHGKAVRTLVATPALKTELAARGFTNLAVWPFGVDVQLFTKRTPPAELVLEKPVFVYVGRLAKEKRVEEFLALELPGSKLLIGDGPDREALQQAYPAATFVGYKHGKALASHMSAADVCVFPSQTETFGLVIIEALACGLPVAAHDVMGPRDILTPGKDGYLAEDLAVAAMRCLTLSPDDCRTKALQYSWEHSAQTFAQSLAEITHI